MLVHFDSHSIPFFMPVYIILGLTLVLLELVVIQRSKWGMIFFLAAWLASFNNKTWVGSLFYSMVYGESVSMILVLSLLSWSIVYKQRAIGSLAVVAFLLGLLALTKFPLILLSVAFFIVFLIRSWDGKNGLRESLLMGVIFVVPFLVFKLFQMKYGGTISSIGAVSFNRLFFPNTDMLWRVIDNFAGIAKNLWYYFLIAAGVSCFSYKHWTYGWPVFLWTLFLFIYYAYIYEYGSIGMGDAGSSLRYFLPAAAGFIFLGSNGIAGLVDLIQRQRDQLFRGCLYMVCVFIILYRIF